ncbi:MAG: hypothetical protein S4CHLAM102_07760 [Chlamydiia bacterium]|nr:hypothetical protein [Chlamydiia bacterium]
MGDGHFLNLITLNFFPRQGMLFPMRLGRLPRGHYFKFT